MHAALDLRPPEWNFDSSGESECEGYNFGRHREGKVRRYKRE